MPLNTEVRTCSSMSSSAAALIIHIIMTYLMVLCGMYKIICVIFSTINKLTEIYNQISSRSNIPRTSIKRIHYLPARS
jgi:hypothetical protein